MGKRIIILAVLPVALTLAAGVGCGSTASNRNEDEFFTSGSAEADRRGEGKVSTNKRGSGKAPKGDDVVEERATLYERLGGEERIRLIVDDFVKRALEDPRVNWTRKGVTDGGLLKRDRSVEWQATPENVRRLKEHLVQFISVAAGGPAKYDGKPMKSTHAGMQIAKAEFDATIGDLKATLDKLNVPTDVQKDLIAIFESTRAQVVPDKR